MSRGIRQKPARLAKKLKEIRDKLGLSQNGMIRRMGYDEKLTQAEISAFERGIRIPPIPVLLEYARAANVYVDALINDAVELPDMLPSNKRHEGIALIPVSKRKRQ
jgi:transcriptional regulator with XRE-family HTH domain